MAISSHSISEQYPDSGIKTNYHTHTTRCGHAFGTDEEYVQGALRNGYTELGFSDHCPWPHASGYVNSGVRMRPEQLPEYVLSLRRLKMKYAGRIRIGIGLECEYFPEHLQWLKEAAEEHQLDYLIFGNHYDLTDEGGMYFGSASCEKELMLYLESTVAGMETGIFSYLAHPDLCMRGYPEFDNACVRMSRGICREAARLGMPLEYNLHGIECKEMTDRFFGEGYPSEGFWQIAAEEGCTAVIGHDAHDSRMFGREELYRAALRHLERLGIKRLEKIDLF